MQEEYVAGKYQSPTKQDILDTLEPGQSPQSRIKHLYPDPPVLPDVSKKRGYPSNFVTSLLLRGISALRFQ